VQTKKITKVPVILVGSSFWSGMKSWIKEVMLEEHQNINPVDLDLMPIVDAPEEVVTIIDEFYADKGEELSPNYEL
jgi:predicted Rossmann-fold nucleotide-binding protein